MSSESPTLSALRALIEAYMEKVESLERNRKPGEGLFGLRGGPKDDACHEIFFEDVRTLLDDFAKTSPSSAEAREVLSALYAAAAQNRECGSAYWMLLAIHGPGLVLTDWLDASDAAALYDELRATYPRRERLPALKKNLAALKAKKES